MDQKRKGTILSFVLIIIKIVITFFYIPFILLHISKEDYGVFSIVGAIMSYIAILDFGINDSTLRYFVKYRLEQDNDNRKELMGSICVIYLGLSILVLIVSFIIYNFLGPLFLDSFSSSEFSLLKSIFIVSVISVFFTILFNPIGALLSAYEEFVFVKTLDIILFLATTGIISVFLVFNYGVFMMVVIAAILNILGLLIKFIYVRTKLNIKIPVISFSKVKIKQIILYASPIFLVVIVEQIYWKLDNILIGSLLGPKLVTFYVMGIVFQKYILSFATAISRIMTPNLISKIDKNVSLEKLNKNYIQTSRIQFVVVILILMNLIFWGKEFLKLWLGEEFEISYSILILIMIPFAIEIIGNLRNTFLQVYGFYWYRGIILLIISIINIILTIYLIDIYGIVGAALSTCLALIVGYITTNLLLFKKVGLNLFLFYKEVWFKATLLILISILGFFFWNKIYYITDWISLLISMLFTSILFIVSCWYFYLKTEEKTILKSVFQRR